MVTIEQKLTGFFFVFSHHQQSKPLYSFEDNSDYVYDVEWSPIHPALFAAVDGMGKVDLWNLNNDTEVSQPQRYFKREQGLSMAPSAQL